MENLIYTQNAISLAILFTGSLFLAMHYEGIRSRLILAATMGVWCLDYALRVGLGIATGESIVPNEYFSSYFLVFGTFFVITTLPFILEMIRPGWIDFRRGFFIFLPWLVLSALYFIVVAARGERVMQLEDHRDFLSHITQFNVWFRVVLLVQMFAYLLFLHMMTIRYRHYYDKWCRENHSDSAAVDVSGLKYIAVGFWFITGAFCLMILDAGMWAYVAHQVAVQFVFMCAFYKGWSHRNPYPEKFFRKTMDEKVAQAGNEMSVPPRPKEDTAFYEGLPRYKETIQRWMESYRPYLRSDLKLLDVAQVLPMNRSYLSRVFNEGFGSSFSAVVCDYRIEYAKELLCSQKDLRIGEIIYMSGFTSPTTFHSSFVQRTGMTPGKFRKIR